MKEEEIMSSVFEKKTKESVPAPLIDKSVEVEIVESEYEEELTPPEVGFLEDQLVILTTGSIKKFLSSDNPGDLMSLYIFYYFTAKRQKTNRVWCTNEFVMNGLHWGEIRMARAKKELIELGLITNIQRRGEEGQVKKWYVRLNYIFTKKTVRKHIPGMQIVNNVTQNPEIKGVVQTPENPGGGFQVTNALSAKYINAYSESKGGIFTGSPKEIFGIYKKLIQPKCRTYPAAKIKRRIKNFGVNQVIKALENFSKDGWYMENCSWRGANWFFDNPEGRFEGFIDMKPRTNTNTGDTPGVFKSKEGLKIPESEKIINN